MTDYRNFSPRAFLEGLFNAAIAAAQPALCVPPHLPSTPPKGRFIVIGAGKASAAMAKAVEDNWQGALEGLVVTRHGYDVACKRIEIVTASHPVPDADGMTAAKRMLQLVANLTADDTVLCLISGGGSALLPLPLNGLDLGEKQRISKDLLACGASIGEINCVRRHLSRIKGGRLAAACYPAKVLTLLISDVPGDDPVDIASGPTVPDKTTCKDALAILAKYSIAIPPAVEAALQDGSAESVKSLDNSDVKLIATPQMALEKAAQLAETQGIAAHIISDRLEGDARTLGLSMAADIAQYAAKAPCVILSGGETTVTVRGTGSGGRNVEFLLSLAVALQGQENVYALAGDTDGVDGTAEIAGAYIGPETLQKAPHAQKFLDNNDAHSYFSAIGQSVVTGPTLTNVNDFRAILLLPTGEVSA
ncbi:MAG: glycerate kinase [Micavibrio sp.]|nr:glycerate kinase [Micavibrio sp.]